MNINQKNNDGNKKYFEQLLEEINKLERFIKEIRDLAEQIKTRSPSPPTKPDESKDG